MCNIYSLSALKYKNKFIFTKKKFVTEYILLIVAYKSYKSVCVEIFHSVSQNGVGVRRCAEWMSSSGAVAAAQ